MSIKDRHLSGRTYDTKNFYPLTLLSLNEMFRESMRKVQAVCEAKKIIVRCETLPTIKGNKEDIGQLFDSLLMMIVKQHTTTQLFLYVDCEETNSGTIDPLPEGFKMYTVKFRTNVSPDESWKHSATQSITRCRQILSGHNAIFLVNSSNQTGCLFTILVPGKM